MFLTEHTFSSTVRCEYIQAHLPRKRLRVGAHDCTLLYKMRRAEFRTKIEPADGRTKADSKNNKNQPSKIPQALFPPQCIYDRWYREQLVKRQGKPCATCLILITNHASSAWGSAWVICDFKWCLAKLDIAELQLLCEKLSAPTQASSNLQQQYHLLTPFMRMSLVV